MSNMDAYTTHLSSEFGDTLSEDRKLLIKLQKSNSKLHFAMDSVAGSFHRLQDTPDLLKAVFEADFVKEPSGLVKRIEAVTAELGGIKQEISQLFED